VLRTLQYGQGYPPQQGYGQQQGYGYNQVCLSLGKNTVQQYLIFFTGSTTNELPAGAPACAEKERRQRLSRCLSRCIVLLLRC
jgi:hypothetical protein